MKRTLFEAMAIVALTAASLYGCFSDRPGAADVSASDCPAVGVDPAGPAVVTIGGFDFGPDTVRVRAGTRVTWINCEPEGTDAHTVTSDGGVWDSPLLSRGGTFARTFGERGVFPYHCTPHPFMKGTVVVD